MVKKVSIIPRLKGREKGEGKSAKETDARWREGGQEQIMNS